MANADSAQVKNRIKGWVQRVGSVRPALSVIWIPAAAIALVVGIWATAVVRIQTEGREARDTAAASTVELASSFSAHIAKTAHDADMVVRWVKFEYERSPGEVQSRVTHEVSNGPVRDNSAPFFTAPPP